MRIMVFDVPAESGGALSVLYDFYEEFKKNEKNEYIFVVSTPKLIETKNIRVLRFPWIKKSWIHRLYFDYFIAPKLIEKYKADKILSLQNIIIPRTKINQTVYVHNALPFSSYKFAFTENRLLWTYQNIISKKIFKSIKKAEKVIVQTNWMKKACLSKLSVDKDKIEVRPPKINVNVQRLFISKDENKRIFFYPASHVIFKNHEIIVRACKKLKEEGINDYRVIFTLNGDENEHIKRLHKIVKDNELPIEFIGSISREMVFDYYTKSTLLFPSFVESLALPLVEAKMHETPIIASDCPFSREVLAGYKRAVYFDPFNEDELKTKMLNQMKGVLL